MSSPSAHRFQHPADAPDTTIAKAVDRKSVPPVTPVTLDVYFDFVCPWCYIGRHRLDRAMNARPAGSVNINWRPYQLNPGIPKGGIDRRNYLVAKFGPIERVAHVLRLIRVAAEADGLPISLEQISRTPNSLDAHRLTDFMVRKGLAPEPFIDRVFKAFMVEGQDIGDPETLTSLAEDVGADGSETAAYLATSGDSDVIEARDQAARRLGIQAVPCFIFNQRYALSGAQEPAAFFPFIDHPEIYETMHVDSGPIASDV